MMAPDLERVVEQYHQAVDEIVKGSADGFRRAYSRRDDVSLANPFGPPVRGWEQVEQTLARAASQMRGGAATGFERIVTSITGAMMAASMAFCRSSAASKCFPRSSPASANSPPGPLCRPGRS